MYVFDITAQSYDAPRAKLIPCFDRFYGTTLALIPDTAKRILDLGAGTGLLSAFVRSRFREAYLHLIDNSQPMLAQAETRFLHDQNVLCQLGDYTSAPWDPSYDAIVSALSIHHLTDDGKRTLFTRIRHALKPGGVFLNAEQILQPTAELELKAKQQWLQDVRDLGATEEQITASLLRQSEDRCATIADQLRWLRDAGFAEVRCPFTEGRFAVFFAA